jgi:hypothetical protein
MAVAGNSKMEAVLVPFYIWPRMVISCELCTLQFAYGKGNLLNSTLYLRFEVFTAVTMKNGVSGMLHRVVLVKTDFSDELSASIIRVS